MQYHRKIMIQRAPVVKRIAASKEDRVCDTDNQLKPARPCHLPRNPSPAIHLLQLSQPPVQDSCQAIAGSVVYLHVLLPRKHPKFGPCLAAHVQDAHDTWLTIFLRGRWRGGVVGRHGDSTGSPSSVCRPTKQRREISGS